MAESSDSSRKPELLNVRQEMMRHRGKTGAFMDGTGRILASPAALLTLLVANLVWVIVNLGVLPWVRPWDPPPFTLLATITSCLAPLLSLMILMRQQRDARINEVREEVNLQVALRIERETSVLLRLNDPAGRLTSAERSDAGREIAQLHEPIKPKELLERVRKHLDRYEGKMTGENGAS